MIVGIKVPLGKKDYLATKVLRVPLVQWVLSVFKVPLDLQGNLVKLVHPDRWVTLGQQVVLVPLEMLGNLEIQAFQGLMEHPVYQGALVILDNQVP